MSRGKPAGPFDVVPHTSAIETVDAQRDPVRRRYRRRPHLRRHPLREQLLEGGAIPLEELVIGALSTPVSKIFNINPPFDLYSKGGFFDVCPYTDGGVSYPTRLTYRDNHDIVGEWEIPRSILNNAGVQP